MVELGSKSQPYNGNTWVMLVGVVTGRRRPLPTVDTAGLNVEVKGHPHSDLHQSTIQQCVGKRYAHSALFPFQFPHQSDAGTPFHHNYYEEGLERGYFVKTQDGSVWTGYSDSTLLDISNPQAYQWMVDIIAEVRGQGSHVFRF